MEKISVIIPVYNAGKYVGECLESVINQTYKNLEIIIVNDGSTDDSLEICKKYEKQDDRIKVISNINSGPSITRNIGLDNATGKYIMFIDADDFYVPNACEIMYNAIERLDVDFVTANFAFAFETGEIWKEPKYNQRKYTDRPLIKDDPGITAHLLTTVVWNKIFKTEFLNKNKIRFENILYGEDVVFTTLAFLKCKSAYYIKDIICNYRQRNRNKEDLSMSFCCKKSFFDETNEAYKKTYKNFCKYKQMNLYKYYYARNTSFVLHRFIDSELLEYEERIEILKEMKWFFNLKTKIEEPLTSSNFINIITDAIIAGKYKEAINYCTILKEIRSNYMTSAERQKMASPDIAKYKKRGK